MTGIDALLGIAVDKITDMSHKIVAALRKSRELRIKQDPNEVRLEIVRAMPELSRLGGLEVVGVPPHNPPA